ncbi:hypothetical protein B0A55_03237 [Friedmanniomyces simplex]|uniref:Uncharacterized protein n=1 Tax=Friedmanniomyces simplex TaxID=329884 RepID=A0A4U0XR20_9PEZI|nr:hypothetical protein B0A55_03237 [Friedmanniomyces simplex]
MAAVTYPTAHHDGRQERRGKRARCLGNYGVALLRTNKTIYYEALFLLYAYNTFVFLEQKQLKTFGKRVKFGVPLIRTVAVVMPAMEYDDVLVSPPQHLKHFTSLRVLEWTLSGLIASLAYPSFRAKDILQPVRAFVMLAGGLADARRAQFNKIRFVTRTSVAKQARGKPGYETADQVLLAMKGELEKSLVRDEVLERLP